MVTIGINTGSTDRGIEKFKEIFELSSRKERAIYARIRYITSQGIDFDTNALNYPLVIFTTDNKAFALADVTAGFGGTGPHGMIEVLNYLGFEFDEKEILEHKEIVQLDLIKPDVKIEVNQEYLKFYLDPFYYASSPFDILTK